LREREREGEIGGTQREREKWRGVREEGKGERNGRERESNTAGRKMHLKKVVGMCEGGGQPQGTLILQKNNMLEEKCVESSCITALPPPHSKYCKCKKKH